jgi:hypothetical protein
MKIKRIKTLALFALLACCALPVSADQKHDKPIAWAELPADARSALAPMADRWDKMKPQQQHRLLSRVGTKKFKQNADRWSKLSPQERERIKESRERFKEMPPEKRQALRKKWESMSEAERQDARRARRALSNYPPKQRHRLLEELRNLPPEQRRARIAQFKQDNQKNKNKQKNNNDQKDHKDKK